MKTTRLSPSPAVLTAVMLLFIGLHMGGYQLAVSSAAAEFGLNTAGMGFLVALEAASFIVAPILSGLLADRLGKKPVLLASSLCVMAGCLMAGLSHRLAPYAVGVFLVGGGGSAYEALSTAALSDCYPGRSDKLINLSQFFFSIGAVLCPILLQSLMNQGAPWRILYGIYGAAYLLILPFLWRLRLPKQAPAREATAARFLRSPAFLLLFISVILYVGLEYGFGYFANTFFIMALETPQLGAYGIAAFWVGTAVSRLVNSVRAMAPDKTLAAYYAISTAALLVLALGDAPWLALAVSFVIGFGYGPIWPCLYALAAMEFPDRSAGVTGVMSSGCGVGGVIYPAVMGLMAQYLTIRIPFFLLAATALAGFGFSVLYIARRRRA